MKTDICKKLGIEYPIFAFTHCRDVVVAVSKAGGIGVLGAVGYSPEQLKEELDWIDEHIGEYPYGVDTVIPQKYEGMDEKNPEQLLESLQKMIPDGHRKFVEDLLSANGVPEAPETNGPKGGLLGWTEATAEPQIEEALKHQNVKLIANALGTPPADMIKKIQDKGVLIGALCGKIKQAVAHKEAGLDFIIAQGGEGGGHTGEIGSIVLWPQIVDAVDGLPVLAAGGIGNGRQMAAAMSTGVQGVWCGSLWLAVEEAAAQPAEKNSYLNATSEDTIRSKAWTGKPARMLKNKFLVFKNSKHLEHLVWEDRRRTWSSSNENRIYLFKPGNTESNIQYIPEWDVFVTTTYTAIDNKILLSFSNRLYGPWSEPQIVFENPMINCPDKICIET